MEHDKITRFLTAHNQAYLKALKEIMDGRKTGHWMWYIFPQLKGLGKSEISEYYALDNIREAGEYLRHPILGKHLVEISGAVLSLDGRTAYGIFGSPDDLKLRSCMTLFAKVDHSDPVFGNVLGKYFHDQQDELTLEFLGKS
ncbi:DUF1810 domain-containing protein [Pedobacter psychrodurus]|uniref:DUF1810 domain-containing protein n=1 Tax=Pedobacter psychrodurus TaxID=2530456 RepID=UPI00292FC565|nr:DUF1810 domain-containing protein [Pedobacter psychrodurus]